MHSKIGVNMFIQ